MRPRAAGGLEPDDAEQSELVELWHLSRTALAGSNYSSYRICRLQWVVDEFLKNHPHAGRKWVYVWAVDNLGKYTRPQ